MGWDLLSGKTTLRRRLLQLLWISKSQVLRLEEPGLYGKKPDKVIFSLQKASVYILTMECSHDLFLASFSLSLLCACHCN